MSFLLPQFHLQEAQGGHQCPIPAVVLPAHCWKNGIPLFAKFCEMKRELSPLLSAPAASHTPSNTVDGASNPQGGPVWQSLPRLRAGTSNDGSPVMTGWATEEKPCCTLSTVGDCTWWREVCTEEESLTVHASPDGSLFLI